MRACEQCGEATDRPIGSVGQGRRAFYGRLCLCDRAWGFRDDVNIAGVGPMAQVLGVSRKQFARIRDRDPKRFHTYLDDNTTDVTSLNAWRSLYGETLVAGIERRKQNLRQYADLESRGGRPGFAYSQRDDEAYAHLEALVADGSQGAKVGIVSSVPTNVPAPAPIQTQTTHRQPMRKRKTR